MKAFLLVILALTLVGPLYVMMTQHIEFRADYRTANRASAHLAPDPKTTAEAVIQVYSARAFNWRGLLATHTWIAIKAKDSPDYSVYQVIGWRLYQGLSPLMIEKDIPDRYWFNQKPRIILDIRGDTAQKLIPEIHAAAASYPYPNEYTFWPGPNSNTLPAYIARQVPALKLTLPPTAIGKDYLPITHPFAKTPSGTGYQFSFLGLFGITLAKIEGIEINFLGLVYGLRFSPLKLLLPGIGEIPI